MSVAGIGNNIAKNNLDQDVGSGTPATWYVALLTSMPADGDGTGLVEVSWTGYARPAVTNNSANFPAAVVSAHIATKTCQALINFGTVAGLGAPVTVVGIALFDASTGGNMGRTAVFGTPSAPVTYVLNNGSSLSIAAGNLSFQEV
jgi:hypothetical protein